MVDEAKDWSRELKAWDADHSKPIPAWQCHKVVHAAKILSMTIDSVNGPVTLHLDAGDPTPVKRIAYPEWMSKHKPEIGGYFVEYEDNYTSYSPAKAFEDGYSLFG